MEISGFVFICAIFAIMMAVLGYCCLKFFSSEEKYEPNRMLCGRSERTSIAVSSDATVEESIASFPKTPTCNIEDPLFNVATLLQNTQPGISSTIEQQSDSLTSSMLPHSSSISKIECDFEKSFNGNINRCGEASQACCSKYETPSCKLPSPPSYSEAMSNR